LAITSAVISLVLDFEIGVGHGFVAALVREASPYVEQPPTNLPARLVVTLSSVRGSSLAITSAMA
jgi:hypothetical protein